ncbi:replication endonuclease [Pseudomonas baetica]|uniref:replication endonuclease n=1 Tax=Pseudomonas baetica TaxID=674054 RepID=UPI002404A276|nr:replication endonuclease [Pseudomonas baetica]MDF9776262.1 hypothetical protein [Pseudomonas baetica]
MKKNIAPSERLSPFEIYYSAALPEVPEIVKFTTYELRHLAHKLAAAYKALLSSTDQAGKRRIIAGRLEYGIKLESTKQSTTDSLALRLIDAKWWRRKIISLADSSREHQAQLNKHLGGRNPSQVCCSEETVAAFTERKEVTDRALKSQYKLKRLSNGSSHVFSLYDIAASVRKNKLNEIFLDIKALENIAQSKDYGCAFITLTAAPEYHSNPKRGRDNYNGATAREANQSLQKDWRSILDALDNMGIKRTSARYFGFRVVEPHEDGCPHWHILFFFEKQASIIETVESSIRRLYLDRGNYFDNQKQDIVRIIEKTNDSTATPSSYIFKYVAFALSSDEDLLALKYKCAIRSMGARQYSFFGIKCAVGKQRALKSISRSDTAPQNIKTMADRLHPHKCIENRNEEQLQARIDFFEKDSTSLRFSTEEVVNRYGETVSANRWIRHDDDDKPVQISGLCEDISEEKAKQIMTGDDISCDIQRRPETEVTIIINYSRNAEARTFANALRPPYWCGTCIQRLSKLPSEQWQFLPEGPDYSAVLKRLGYSPREGTWNASCGAFRVFCIDRLHALRKSSEIAA